MSLLGFAVAASLAFEVGDRVPVTVDYSGFEQRTASAKATALALKAWAAFCSTDSKACAPPSRYRISMTLGPGPKEFPGLDYCVIEIQDVHAWYRCSADGSIIRDDTDTPDIRTR